MLEQGTVKWFSKVRGFGFISPDGEPNGPDVFVHWTQILTGERGQKNLVTDQVVTFERKIKDGKPTATKVEIVGGE
jgi:CspA family cold shock protein